MCASWASLRLDACVVVHEKPMASLLANTHAIICYPLLPVSSLCGRLTSIRACPRFADGHGLVLDGQPPGGSVDAIVVPRRLLFGSLLVLCVHSGRPGDANAIALSADVSENLAERCG